MANDKVSRGVLTATYPTPPGKKDPDNMSKQNITAPVGSTVLLGRHLSNIYDHRRPDAESLMIHDYRDHREGPQAMHAAWLLKLDWINQNMIGPPRSTPYYTRAYLEAQGMIGNM